MPYDTCRSSDSALGQRVPPPPRATSEVWLPPSRPLVTVLPTPKRRSVHGLSPSRPSPHPQEVPLSGSLPSRRFPRCVATPERVTAARVASRASCLRRVRAVASQPKLPGRRSLPGLLPFRAFTSHVRAIASSHDAGPLVLGRGDVPTRLNHRASRSVRIGWLVSELPALMGFRTFRLSRHAVHRSGKRAHGFASRGMLPDGQPRPRSLLPRTRCSHGS